MYILYACITSLSNLVPAIKIHGLHWTRKKTRAVYKGVEAVEKPIFTSFFGKDVAEKLDIHPYMLSRWRKEYREGKIVIDKRQKLTNPLFLLTVFGKGEKANLSKTERNDFAKFTTLLLKSYGESDG